MYFFNRFNNNVYGSEQIEIQKILGGPPALGAAGPSCMQVGWSLPAPAAAPWLARPASHRLVDQAEATEEGGVLHLLHPLGQVQLRRALPLPQGICSNSYCPYRHVYVSLRQRSALTSSKIAVPWA